MSVQLRPFAPLHWAETLIEGWQRNELAAELRWQHCSFAVRGELAFVRRDPRGRPCVVLGPTPGLWVRLPARLEDRAVSLTHGSIVELEVTMLGRQEGALTAEAASLHIRALSPELTAPLGWKSMFPSA